MQKAFIIGKMVGQPRLGQTNFDWLGNKLISKGIEVLTPLMVFETVGIDTQHKDIIKMCVEKMIECETVVLMNQNFSDCPIAEALQTVAAIVCTTVVCVDKVFDGQGAWIYDDGKFVGRDEFQDV